jgi:hypothetical protein
VQKHRTIDEQDCSNISTFFEPRGAHMGWPKSTIQSQLPGHRSESKHGQWSCQSPDLAHQERDKGKYPVIHRCRQRLKPAVRQECPRLGDWQNLAPQVETMTFEYSVIVFFDSRHIDVKYHKIELCHCYDQVFGLSIWSTSLISVVYGGVTVIYPRNRC